MDTTKVTPQYNPYIENGYRSREQYFESLSEEYNVSLEVIIEMAEFMGQSEDFDGLVNMIKDFSIIW